MTLIDLGLLCLFPVLFILSKALNRKEWVELTDEDIDDLVKNTKPHELIKATEVKLKEKNL